MRKAIAIFATASLVSGLGAAAPAVAAPAPALTSSNEAKQAADFAPYFLIPAAILLALPVLSTFLTDGAVRAIFVAQGKEYTGQDPITMIRKQAGI